MRSLFLAAAAIFVVSGGNTCSQTLNAILGTGTPVDTIKNVTSAGQCCNECYSFGKGCVAYTYYSKTLECQLKPDATYSRAVHQVFSGTKGDPFDFDCPFRQLAFRFAAARLFGRGTSNVAAALNLSASASDSDIDCPVPSGEKLRGPRPVSPAEHSVSETTLYVDPSGGDDSNPGSIDKPLRTLRGAQNAVRKADPRNGATVYLRGGVYYQGADGPVVFGPSDSGSDGKPVTYSSYKDEKVVVSGGTLLAPEWTPVSGEAGVFSTPVPKGLSFNSLFAQSRREIRARFPNGDPVVPGDGFTLRGSAYDASRAKSGEVSWTNNVEIRNSDGVVVGTGPTRDGAAATVTVPLPSYPRPSWTDFRSNYNGTSSRFDHTYNTDTWGANTIQGVKDIQGLDGAGTWKDASTAYVHMYHAQGWGGWQFSVASRPLANALLFECKSLVSEKILPCTTQARDEPVVIQGGWQEARGNSKAGAFYVENVRELLDSEREWFLDEKESVLYYMPPAGLDVKSATFVAANRNSAIEVRGEPGKPVSNIVFSGITITQTATTFMETYEVPSGGDWALYRGSALFVDGPADQIEVSNCMFDQVGGNALMFSNDVSNSRIVNNSFVNIGESAVLMVGSSKLVNATRGAGRIPSRNTIANNLVDTVGVFGKQTSAYFKSLSDSNILRDNVFFNGPRAGVNFNDGGPGGEQMIGNLVFNFVRESGDHGMFNSWDRQPWLYTAEDGSTRLAPKTQQIRGNLCLNQNYATTRKTNSAYCFDHDDGSSEYNSTNNVMVLGGFKIRDGVNRAQSNNLVVNARLADPQVSGFNSTTIENNVAISNSGDFYACVGKAMAGGTLTQNNQYFTPGNDAVPFHESSCADKTYQTLADWQQAGFDKGSTISSDMTVEKAIALAEKLLGM